MQSLPVRDMVSFGKRKHGVHPKVAIRSIKQPFQLVYMGLLGPISLPSLAGYKHVSKFTYQHRKWKQSSSLRKRGNAINAAKHFNQAVVILSRMRIERLRANRRGAYQVGYLKKHKYRERSRWRGLQLIVSHPPEDKTKNNQEVLSRYSTGIHPEVATNNTPQQNGVPGCDGRTLTNIARCLLKDDGFSSIIPEINALHSNVSR